MYTRTIHSQRGQSESEHSARPNIHIHINCRPEFKWKHLLSVISKDTDMRVFQTDKSRAARRTTSGASRAGRQALSGPPPDASVQGGQWENRTDTDCSRGVQSSNRNTCVNK